MLLNQQNLRHKHVKPTIIGPREIAQRVDLSFAALFKLTGFDLQFDWWPACMLTSYPMPHWGTSRACDKPRSRNHTCLRRHLTSHAFVTLKANTDRSNLFNPIDPTAPRTGGCVHSNMHFRLSIFDQATQLTTRTSTLQNVPLD